MTAAWTQLSSPGTSGTGTNPEQLFASGYAARFIGAMKAGGGKIGIPVPQDVHRRRSGPGPHPERLRHRRPPGHQPARPGQGHGPEAGGRRPPGLPPSNATRGNIDVTITLV